MGAYEDALEHIAEPSKPSERDDADSITLEDHVALWLTEKLRDCAHYHFDSPHSTIAVGLASYIDKKVRDEANSHVTLYLHTSEAIEAVVDTAEHAPYPYGERVTDKCAALTLEQ